MADLQNLQSLENLQEIIGDSDSTSGLAYAFIGILCIGIIVLSILCFIKSKDLKKCKKMYPVFCPSVTCPDGIGPFDCQHEQIKFDEKNN